MTELNQIEIKKIAKLARLELGAEELVSYAEELSKILAMIEKIQNVDTSNVEPMAHPLNLTQKLREDNSENTQVDFATIFQNAPKMENNLFVVPRIIADS